MTDAVQQELSGALEATTLEDLLSRHRRERKELQAKIQALKKNAPKSDKKKRKEVMEEVTRLELDMDQRHEREVKATEQKEQNCSHATVNNSLESPVDAIIPTENQNDISCDSNNMSESAPQRITKAQKRRDKKAAEARQREEEIRAAAEEAQYAPKTIEANTLQTKLRERQLGLHHINSDGDCLYNAVRHQLQQHGLKVYSVQELRTETANYIRAQKDALICYMTNPNTGDLLNDAEFENYCETLRSTPAWGGQIELKALSSVLKVPIEVLQAEGPPTVQGADEFAGPNLTITYHRHLYSLGEHYNSTLPQDETPTDDTEC